MQRNLYLILGFSALLLFFGLSSPKTASADYPEGCRAAFQASNGQWLSADGGGGGGLYATGGGPYSWETFTLSSAGAGKYFIQAGSGHYWMANDGGNSWVNAGSSNRLSWETFEIAELGGGYVSIQSINDYYVAAEGGGGGDVNADRSVVLAWETFWMEKISGCDLPDAAQFVSQSVPTTMAAGSTYSISVTMRNLGPTWGAYSDYKLGDRCDCNTWIDGARVQTTSNVGTGSNYTFTFNVHAPTTPGTYTMRWKMVRERSYWIEPFSDDVTINVIDPTPSLTGLTISPGAVKPDNATPYSITVSGTNPTGGGNISHEYAWINLQSGNQRGYLTWYWHNKATWSGWAVEKDNKDCSGGGQAAIQQTGANSASGYQYLTMDSCSTSVSGNTRTTTFNVRFTSTFTAPVTGNDISGYVHDGPTGRNTNWINVDLNFRLAFPPAFDSVSPVNTIFLTNTNSLSLTVNNFRNANAIRFYIWTPDSGSGPYGAQDDIICPTFPVNENTTAATQTFIVPLTSQSNCWTGTPNQTLDVGRVSVHVYAFNSANDNYAIGYNYFTRSYPGNVNINIDAGVGWTLTAPAGWTPATYSGTGPQNLTNLPYGSYTLTPAARAGYTSQVAPSTIQVLQ